MPAGDFVNLAANRSVFLDQPDRAWIVERGHVLLFAVELEDGLPNGSRHLVATLEPGDLVLCGPANGGGPLGLVLVGSGEAEVREVELASVCRGELEGHDAGEALESWVRVLSTRLTKNRLSPAELIAVPFGRNELVAGATVRPIPPAAIARLDIGLVGLCGVDAATIGADDGPIALGQEAWFEALDDSTLELTELGSAIGESWLADALRRFTALCLTVLAHEVVATTNDRRDEAERLGRADAESQHRAVEELAGVLASRRQSRVRTRQRDPALGALALVLDDLGMTLPEDDPQLQRIDPTLAAADRVRLGAHLVACRVRTITLPDQWWTQDVGPFVASLGENRPVALLHDWRGYTMHDPAERSARRVDAELAAAIGTRALSCYVPLAENARKIASLLRIGINRSGSDVAALFIFGSAAGLASLVTPVLTGLVFNDVIPSDERGRLGAAVLTLAVVAIAVAAGSVARGIAFVRIRARFSNQASSALWDRLLRLPAGFFSRHLSGALAARARAVEMVQQVLTDSVVASVLNGIFSLFNLALFYVAGGTLFLVGVGLVAVQLSMVVASTLVQVNRSRAQIGAQNRTQGLGLQLIRGIDKLRVAAAERRAYEAWAHRFSQQSRAAYASGQIGLPVSVVNGSWSTLTTLAVTGALAAVGLGHVSVGSFIEFTTALAQVSSGIGGMVSGLGTVAVVVPILELPRPILETNVESGGGREQPGTLSGAVEVNHVSFRYNPDAPLVLDDVSLSAAPGEFIALVGPSGAGKSSLVRLLLGFEVPEFGTVAYDDKDLQSLDTTAVRRQIGTVIQSARLLPGTVFSNISGGAPITRDDAWEAAAAAGVDEDIRAMPMAMETLISEGGGVVSGGQRQRILIARALALRPRVVLFDEATSALDNITQAIVTESLSRLQVTRIVIAHRLSTVRDADRIYVLQRGRVVETGSYDELMTHEGGVFQRLALRQLV